MRLWAWTVASVLAATPALAESKSKSTTAEALFAEGRQLMALGRHGEACPKFEASERLDPGIGTLLNLAECYEKVGRTASAWASFREAAAAARAAGSSDREEIARARAAALEPRLSRLKLTVTAHTEGLELRRDGAVVDAAELGAALPVDPGRYEVQASAPGKKTWSKVVEISPNTATIEIQIPELLEADASGAAPSPAGTTISGTKVVPHALPSAGEGSRVPALVVGGIGLIGVGVGAYFGLRARTTFKDAKEKCEDYPFACGEDGDSLAEDASLFGTVSTISFAVGGAALAGGVVLWLTSNPRSGGLTAVSLSPSQLVASGRF